MFSAIKQLKFSIHWQRIVLEERVLDLNVIYCDLLED